MLELIGSIISFIVTFWCAIVALLLIGYFGLNIWTGLFAVLMFGSFIK